ncbi:hypothetical protein ACNUDN_03333 [Mycobacterium sp. smrl_JER01]
MHYSAAPCEPAKTSAGCRATHQYVLTLTVHTNTSNSATIRASRSATSTTIHYPMVVIPKDGQHQAVITSAIPDDTVAPQELAYAPIKALVQVIENDPSMARILFVESGAEPLLRQLRSELMTDFAELVLREARLHLEIPSDVLQVADLAATYGVGGLFEILRRWIDGQLNHSTEMLIEHGAGFLGSLGLYTLGQAPDQGRP